MKVYTDPRLFDLAGAVAKLPPLGAATGGEQQPVAVAPGTDAATPLVGRLVGTGFRTGRPVSLVGTTAGAWPNEKSPGNRGKIQLVTATAGQRQSNEKALQS